MPFIYPWPFGLGHMSFWPSSLWIKAHDLSWIHSSFCLPLFWPILSCTQVVNVSLKLCHLDSISATSAKAWNQLENWRLKTSAILWSLSFSIANVWTVSDLPLCHCSLSFRFIRINVMIWTYICHTEDHHIPQSCPPLSTNADMVNL